MSDSEIVWIQNLKALVQHGMFRSDEKWKAIFIEQLDRVNAAQTAAEPILPADIVSSLLAVGTVEWGQTFCQSDEKHVEDFANTLQLTRSGLGITDQETTIHYVCIADTATIVALTGNSPNSAQRARILAGAWNHLLELAKNQTAEQTSHSC